MIIKQILKKTLFSKGGVLYKLLNEIRLRQGARNLKKYGHPLLSSLVNTANSMNIPIWLEFGTLLGAYREKSFIKHDFDIDCGMYAKDYTLAFEDNLLSKGFFKIRSFYKKNINTNEEILTEVTFDYYGLLVDIFFYRTEDGERYAYGYRKYDDVNEKKHIFKVIKSYYPAIKGFSELPIDDHLYPVPSNTEEMLKRYYGDDFMTPIKNFVTSLKRSHHHELNFAEHRGYLKGFRAITDR